MEAGEDDDALSFDPIQQRVGKAPQEPLPDIVMDRWGGFRKPQNLG
jgi:hypothetical protein